MTTFLWLLVIAGGPVLIGLVLAYGMMRSRRLTRVEEDARERAVEDMYDTEHHGGAVRDPVNQR
jgi:hypothetical protein